MEHITAKALIKSKYFQRNKGKDHVVIAGDYHLQSSDQWERLFRDRILSKIAFGTFEELTAPNYNHIDRVETYHSLARCPFVVPYTTGRAKAKRQSSGFNKWLARPITYHFMGQFDDRKGYRLRTLVADVIDARLENTTAIFAQSSKSNSVSNKTSHLYKRCNFKKCL